MDLNELHFRHQIALMRSARSSSRRDCQHHARAAAGYAARIGLIQRRNGALAAPLGAPACAGHAA